MKTIILILMSSIVLGLIGLAITVVLLFFIDIGNDCQDNYIPHYNYRTKKWAAGSSQPRYSDVYVYLNDVKGNYHSGVTYLKEFETEEEVIEYIKGYHRWLLEEQKLPKDKFVPVQPDNSH